MAALEEADRSRDHMAKKSVARDPRGVRWWFFRYAFAWLVRWESPPSI